MKKLFSHLALALLLGACAAPGAQTQSTKPDNTTPSQVAAAATMQEVVPGSVNVMFLDTTGFDKNLSQGLRGRIEEVVIDVPSKFSLNEIPDRMSVWLSKVQDSGGKVQAQPIPAEGSMATRGLFGLLIDVVVSLADVAMEKAMYGPAEDYNVLMHYNPETGEVEKAVFYHR